jgi:hypothetical protein
MDGFSAGAFVKYFKNHISKSQESREIKDADAVIHFVATNM